MKNNTTTFNDYFRRVYINSGSWAVFLGFAINSTIYAAIYGLVAEIGFAFIAGILSMIILLAWEIPRYIRSIELLINEIKPNSKVVFDDFLYFDTFPKDTIVFVLIQLYMAASCFWFSMAFVISSLFILYTNDFNTSFYPLVAGSIFIVLSYLWKVNRKNRLKELADILKVTLVFD